MGWAIKPRFLLVTVLVLLFSAVPAVQAEAAAALPNGFSLNEITNALNQPVAFGFTASGRMYVAEKRGTIQVFDSIADPSPSQVIDVSNNVHDYWDRGLLGFAVDPGFGSGSDFLYLLYTYDPGNSWGDDCADPTGVGCLVNGRLSRFPIQANGTAGAEQQLLTGKWCGQFPSHTVGDLAFSEAGHLLVSGGDGASFNFADHGQNGNPCGDPLGQPGRADNMGGALRSQRPSDHPDVTYDGTVLRIDKATGDPIVGNPSGTDTRIIAQGLRNPFRIAVRPGTSEVWVADVGWGAWEEINRVVDPGGTRENFGWPCYEGNNSGTNARQGGYDGLDVDMCENLYNAGQGAVVAPHYARPHEPANTHPGCSGTGGAISGLAFYQDGDYPAQYDGALFIADYSIGCIRVMFPDGSGVPSKGTISSFVGAAAPVDLQIGPEGDLYYADIGSGRIVRVAYENAGPTAIAAANPTTGGTPLQVQFDGTGSTDPEGDTLTFAWDLDGDGQYDDSTSPQPTWTYTSAGQVVVGLQVTDPFDNADADQVLIDPVDNQSPTADIASPNSLLTWSVGDTINFSGSASDPEGGVLPASALTWEIVMNHCEEVGSCHEHIIQTIEGEMAGSFTAPDHPYPSYLTIRLTATDSGGLTHQDTVDLQPNTTVISIATSPAGLTVEAGTEGLDAFIAPHSITAIEGGSLSLNAPNQSLEGATYNFSTWSNGQPQAHTITVPVTDLTLTANFDSVGGPFTLTASKTGSGSGQVRSTPSGIRCGNDCTEAYTTGTLVTLTASPTGGSTFAGWSGDCTGTGSCIVTMDAAKGVTATFNTGAGGPFMLTVTKTGSGSGTVTSSPNGINCGNDCTQAYANSTLVTLTASPIPGSTFAGWSGDCTGTGSCIVTMDAAKGVTATFNTAVGGPFTLTASKTGTGSGQVRSTPSGIRCGNDCTEAYTTGTLVTLTASPAGGSTFAGWSGDCTGTGSCIVTMDAAKGVTATFNGAGGVPD